MFMPLLNLLNDLFDCFYLGIVAKIRFHFETNLSELTFPPEIIRKLGFLVISGGIQINEFAQIRLMEAIFVYYLFMILYVFDNIC